MASGPRIPRLTPRRRPRTLTPNLLTLPHPFAFPPVPPQPATRFTLRILGHPSVQDAGGRPTDLPAGKPLALLAFLERSGSEVHKTEATGVFWPASSSKRAGASLRQALWTLRTTLHEDIVLFENDVLSIPDGMLVSDVAALEEALDAGEVARAGSLWNGGPFSSFRIAGAPDFNRWVDEMRTRLERRLGGALREAAADAEARSEPEEALELYRLAAAVEPYSRDALLGEARCLVGLRRFDAAELVLSDRGRGVALDPAEEEDLRAQIRAGRRSRDASRASRVTLPFVGREREFAELLTRWRGARTGRGQVVGLLGPEGSGKTRLLEEVTSFAEAAGAEVLSLAPIAGDEEVALGLVARVVEGLSSRRGAAGVSAGSQLTLHALHPSASKATEVPGSPTPAALADAIADLVAAVAHENVLLVTLDDLQWADPESVAVLTTVFRSLRDASVLSVLACRSGGAGGPARRRLEALAGAGAAELLRLAPLSAEEIRELLVLSAEVPDPVDLQALVARVAAAAGGRPGRVEALLAELRRKELLVEGPEGWSFDPGVQEERAAFRRRGRETPDAAPTGSGPLARLAFAAALGALVIAASSMLVPRSEQADYGDGTIVAQGLRETLLIEPPRRGAGWSVIRRLPNGEVPVTEAALLPDGRVRRFAQGASLDDPASVEEVLEDGSRLPFLRSPRDISLVALSPSGRLAIVTEADPSPDTYEHHVFRTELATRTHHPVELDRPGALTDALWSPDEAWVVRLVNSARDSIVIHRPDGSARRSVAAPHRQAGLGDWCGGADRVLVRGWRDDGSPALYRLDVSALEFVPVPVPFTLLGGWPMACSPEGTHLLAAGVVDRARRWILLDLRTGELEVLPEELFRDVRRVRWTAPRDRFPVEVRLPDGPLELAWGGRERLPVAVEFTDGTREGPVQWTSRSPEIVSVGPDGFATGNARGTAWIVASVNDWLRDSVWVRVTGEPPEAVLMADRFASVDTTTWMFVGSPPPVAWSEGTDTAVDLNGDNLWVDGIVSRRDFDLTLGGTLDVDVKLPLTLDHGQKIELCLVERELPARGPIAAGGYDGQAICFEHPFGGFQEFDSTSYRFDGPLPTRGTRYSPRLPLSDWRTVSIQLRPDGLASLFLDGEFEGSVDVPARNHGDVRWRVQLLSRALETRVLVRNLVLWGVERYDVPG